MCPLVAKLYFQVLKLLRKFSCLKFATGIFVSSQKKLLCLFYFLHLLENAS